MFEVCPFRGEPAQVEGQEPPLYHSSCGAPLFDGKVAGGKASGGSKTGGAAVGERRQNAAGGKADGAQVNMRYEVRVACVRVGMRAWRVSGAFGALGVFGKHDESRCGVS
jgi:hypothetical protein